jgi:hypothetical protein
VEGGNPSVVGISTTDDGLGYWLASSDGGVFSFGDASFQGGMGGQAPQQADRRPHHHPVTPRRYCKPGGRAGTEGGPEQRA